jgi:plastocyanin
MIHRLWQGKKRRGVYAPAGVLVACGVLAAVGVAGAAQDETIGVIDTSDPQRFTPPDVDVETGDTVTWDFAGSTTVHNVAAANDVPADPNWGKSDQGDTQFFASAFVMTGTAEYTFTQEGVYQFVCQAHPQMVGTVTVTGPPVTPTPTPPATPTMTPTATPTPAATPTPTPTPDDHTSTPPPTANASDTTAPTLSGVKAKGIRRGARVRFKLSEPATVTIRVKKKSGKVVRTSRLQVRPGTRTATVRSSRLKRGRYRVELQARDSSGNRSALLRSALRIRRK